MSCPTPVRSARSPGPDAGFSSSLPHTGGFLERRTSSFEKRALRRLQGSGWDAIQHRLSFASRSRPTIWGSSADLSLHQASRPLSWDSSKNIKRRVTPDLVLPSGKRPRECGHEPAMILRWSGRLWPLLFPLMDNC